MGYAHIRDVMSISKEQFKDGKVSTRTLCGLEDPKMNTLEFATPEGVFHKKMKNYCEKCRNIWTQEYESDRQQKRAMHKFRKLIHNAQNLNRLRGK